MDYTPAEALQFSEVGRLVDWIEAFLNSAGGNPAFWEGLCLQPRWWQAPQQKSLSQLTRVTGPEPHMEYRQDEVVFEERIQEMVASLEAGWQPPRLLWNIEVRQIYRCGTVIIGTKHYVGLAMNPIG